MPRNRRTQQLQGGPFKGAQRGRGQRNPPKTLADSDDSDDSSDSKDSDDPDYEEASSLSSVLSLLSVKITPQKNPNSKVNDQMCVLHNCEFQKGPV